MDKRILNLALFTIISIASFGQAPTGNTVVVEVSKEKTTVNGKTYYLHTVKKGENLYRISIAYGVKQKDIVIANPETISGSVKDGQILKIPVDPVTPRSIQYIESDNFIYHITEEQQTIFSITQKYKVSQEELVKYNPELEFSQLQVGQVIRIPKKENVSENAESFHPIENYAEHKVRRRETKYSISKEYNITVDELIAANPELNTEDLKTGSVIRVPVKSITQIETKSLIDHKDSLVSLSQKPKPIELAPCNNDYVPFTGQFNVALLLPFSLDDNEVRARLDSATIANNPDKHFIPEMLSRTVYSLEFYEGFLLAVDSLKKAGLAVNIYPFDSGKDFAKMNKILSKPELKSMDMVIGPFFNEGLEKVNTFCLENGIILVSPVITNSNILADNPNAFQVIPTDSVAIGTMLQLITRFQRKNIILVNPSNLKDTAIYKMFKNQMDIDFHLTYRTISSKNSNTITTLLATDSIENIIIVPSTDEVLLMPIFARLNLDSKKFRIKVFGLPDLASFKSIDQEYMHNLEVHYYSPFYIDYNKPFTHKFIAKFESKFSAPPQDFQKEGYNFAFLGYDVGLYFLNALGQQGKAFGNCQTANSYQLHMIFDFIKPKPEGGHINRGTQIIKFSKDYYIRKAN